MRLVQIEAANFIFHHLQALFEIALRLQGADIPSRQITEANVDHHSFDKSSDSDY